MSGWQVRDDRATSCQSSLCYNVGNVNIPGPGVWRLKLSHGSTFYLTWNNTNTTTHQPTRDFHNKPTISRVPTYLMTWMKAPILNVSSKKRWVCQHAVLLAVWGSVVSWAVSVKMAPLLSDYHLVTILCPAPTSPYSIVQVLIYCHLCPARQLHVPEKQSPYLPLL